jgi:class 3 adenylate cyclase
MSQTEWSDVGMSDLLPTGMVTLLLADIEGSTQLWETHSDDTAAAVSRLDRTVVGVVAAHHGVRPVEQGEGDSFVIAFARASDGLRVPWNYSGHRWRRSDCALACTPAKSSCAMKATT